MKNTSHLVGLDQHQVRRWTTLAMLAHAFLAVATAIERNHTPTPAGLIEPPSTNSADSSTPCCSAPSAPSTHCSPGHTGADDTKPEPANATIDDTNTNDHELRLQY